MAVTNITDMTGMIEAVLDKYRKDKLTDLTSDLQKYTALSSIMKKHRMAWDGGEQYSFLYQHDTPGNAKVTGLFADDSINVRDDIGKGRVPLRHFTTNTAWDHLEDKFNQGGPSIVKHIKARKRAAMIDMHKLMEDQFWGKPTSSSDDDYLFGIDYWITYPSTWTVDGFVGGNPSGFTSGAAGINSTTLKRWANYYARYTAATYDDLGITWTKAAMRCHFEPAIPHQGGNEASEYAYYTNMNVDVELGRVIKDQNDNWSNEVVAGQSGKKLFRRVPINWVPQLDAALANDTDTRSDMAGYNPVYGVDWSTFRFYFFKNEWMRQTVKPSGTKHNVTEAHWDLTANLVCENRRPNFLLSTAIS